MTHADQITAALAWIAIGTERKVILHPPELRQLQALAADYEARGEEIERLKRENALLQERNSKLAAQQLLDMAKIETLNAEVARATYGRPYD